MRFLFAILCLALLAITSTSAGKLTESHYQSLFTDYMVKYNKKYETEHLFHRYNIFKNNVDFINQVNDEKRSYQLAVNHFADLTSTEFQLNYLGYEKSSTKAKSNNKSSSTTIVNDNLPESLDWRVASLNPKNIVAINPVKNQGQCSSCWSFSTACSIEAAHAIATGKLVSLSEQQLVDCSGANNFQGCDLGAWMDDAFNWVIKQGSAGLCTENSYPYVGVSEECHQKPCQTGATIRSYVDVDKNHEAAMKQAVYYHGPLAIALDAANQVFQFYSGGIVDDRSCGNDLDHAVVVIGYGIEKSNNNQQAYWIVRNSWGQQWGEHGYIRLAYGQNQCGMASVPSYPVV